MKQRKDYVSNSSSCSFIVKVDSQDDLDQLSKPKPLGVLKKYADSIASDPNLIHFGTDRRFNGITDICVGDYIRIYKCEDSDYVWDLNPCPEEDLISILDELNEGFGKLRTYADSEAHYTIGDEIQ